MHKTEIVHQNHVYCYHNFYSYICVSIYFYNSNYKIQKYK